MTAARETVDALIEAQERFARALGSENVEAAVRATLATELTCAIAMRPEIAAHVADATWALNRSADEFESKEERAA